MVISQEIGKSIVNIGRSKDCPYILSLLYHENRNIKLNTINTYFGCFNP